VIFIQPAQRPGFEEIVAGGDAMPRLRRVSQQLRMPCHGYLSAVGEGNVFHQHNAPAWRPRQPGSIKKAARSKTDHRGIKNGSSWQAGTPCHGIRRILQHQGLTECQGLKNASIKFLRVLFFTLHANSGKSGYPKNVLNTTPIKWINKYSFFLYTSQPC